MIFSVFFANIAILKRIFCADHVRFSGPCVQSPQVHLVVNPALTLNTKAHFVLKYFTNKRILHESKYLDACLYNCFDTSGQNITLIFR